MIHKAWIAVGFAALLVGCGGAGAGSVGSNNPNLSSTTGGSTSGLTSTTGTTGTASSTTGSSSTGGTTSGTTGTTGSTTGGTTGKGTTGTTGSTTGGTTGSSTGSTTGSTTGITTGSTSGGSTGSSTTGSSTGTTGGSTGSTTGTTGGTTGSSTGSSTSSGSTGSTTGGSTGTTTGTTGGTTGSSTGSTTGTSTGSTTGSTSGGSTGSSTGGSTGSTGGAGGSTGSVSVFATDDGSAPGNSGNFSGESSVVVNLYEADLLTAGGSTVVFSNPDGTPIDVKQLRDQQGPKFQFLDQTVVAAGSYTGVRLFLSRNISFVLASNGKTLTKQFSPTLVSNGYAVVTYNFNQSFVVGATATTLAINFDLKDWIDNNGVVTPHIGQGSIARLSNPSRQIRAHVAGFIKNLSAGQSFDLRHGNSMVHTLINQLTEVSGNNAFGVQSLRNNQKVNVLGTWNPTTHNLSAISVKVN